MTKEVILIAMTVTAVIPIIPRNTFKRHINTKQSIPSHSKSQLIKKNSSNLRNKNITQPNLKKKKVCSTALGRIHSLYPVGLSLIRPVFYRPNLLIRGWRHVDHAHDDGASNWPSEIGGLLCRSNNFMVEDHGAGMVGSEAFFVSLIRISTVIYCMNID